MIINLGISSSIFELDTFFAPSYFSAPSFHIIS